MTWKFTDSSHLVASRVLDGGATESVFVSSLPAETEISPEDVEKVTVVTARQFRLALYQIGLLEQAEAAVAAADRPTQITWEFAQEIQRDYPLLLAMATGLGKTEAEIDAVFTLAATFE